MENRRKRYETNSYFHTGIGFAIAGGLAHFGMNVLLPFFGIKMANCGNDDIFTSQYFSFGIVGFFMIASLLLFLIPYVANYFHDRGNK